MLNYALHTLIKMISKIHYRKMSNQMINVSQKFNNYNTKIISTKCFSKKLFPSEILPFSSLTSHFFICLERFKNLRNVMPYQTILLGRIVKDTRFLFFLMTGVVDESPR